MKKYIFIWIIGIMFPLFTACNDGFLDLNPRAVIRTDILGNGNGCF